MSDTELADDDLYAILAKGLETSKNDPRPGLENCPFCAGEARYFQGERRMAGHGESEDVAGVECTNCEARIVERYYANDKVLERQLKCAEKWNKRA